jgi:hypothetical protein
MAKDHSSVGVSGEIEMEGRGLLGFVNGGVEGVDWLAGFKDISMLSLGPVSEVRVRENV